MYRHDFNSIITLTVTLTLTLTLTLTHLAQDDEGSPVDLGKPDQDASPCASKWVTFTLTLTLTLTLTQP